MIITNTHSYIHTYILTYMNTYIGEAMHGMPEIPAPNTYTQGICTHIHAHKGLI